MSDMPPRPKEYKPGSGKDRYARFAEDWLDAARTHVLDSVLGALAEHQQVLVIGGNGVGKSFFVGVGGIAALYTNPHTIVHVTAGTSTTLKNNIWKPARGLFRDAKENYGLPGRTLDGTREIRTEIGDKWYFECISPRYPDDLEGPHNEHVIYFIEEADKPGVTAEHIDSVRSTVTDENDRVVVVANPPTDETNIVHELLESDEWHVLQFPSWESHNVRVERGIEEGEYIGGLVSSDKIQSDWEEYHEEEWPGLEQVIEWSDPDSDSFRKDLHQNWYKRRAGIVPPEGSSVWRPFEVADVEAAYNRATEATEYPSHFAIDVARSSDNTIGTGLHGKELQVHYSRKGTNHVQQRKELTDTLYTLNSPEIAVDAVGEGSGLADELNETFANVVRFSNGMKPRQESEYYDAWAEALDTFGDFLDSGGSFSSKQLYEEALAAARAIEFTTRSLTSRGGEVIEATSKEQIKERLGHSPDFFDSAIMAVWLANTKGNSVEVVERKARSRMLKGR